MSVELKYSDLPRVRPDLATIEAEAARLIRAWGSAIDGPAQAGLVVEWDRSRRTMSTQRALAFVRFEQNTGDPEARETKALFDDLAPRVTELSLDFLRLVVESPCRPELEERFGAHAFRLWESALSSFDPSIADDRRRESQLATEYTSLVASLRIPFRGEEHTVSSIGAYFGDADRAVRLESQQARFRAYEAHADELDRIYDELVRLRHGMARKLGRENFVPVAYEWMKRTDYGPEQVAAFRKEVREVVVPVTVRIRQAQARRLGIDPEDHGFHDHAVRDLLGVPRPLGGHDWMTEKAQSVFDALGPEFGDFFRIMRDRELMDMEARDGKAGGGFCVDLPDHGVPFIFGNFNGSEDDVRVFTHECGHAFQFHSAQHHELSDYHVPTNEAAEIHSMSMEMLCAPLAEEFFGDGAERFRVGHLEKALLFIPYGVAIDEFQHRVYEEPSASPAQRAEIWKELEATYLPGRRFHDMPFAEGGRFWQVQRHVFRSPFYYIDYCLAQACALQFWQRAEDDRTEALRSYVELCRLGGSRSFTELVSAVGLRSPFEAGCLSAAVERVEAVLGK